MHHGLCIVCYGWIAAFLGLLREITRSLSLLPSPKGRCTSKPTAPRSSCRCLACSAAPADSSCSPSCTDTSAERWRWAWHSSEYMVMCVTMCSCRILSFVYLIVCLLFISADICVGVFGRCWAAIRAHLADVCSLRLALLCPHRGFLGGALPAGQPLSYTAVVAASARFIGN